MADNFFRVKKGLNVKQEGASTASEAGDMDVSGGKLNYHNGTTASPMVTEAHTATLTNKNLSDSTTAIVDESDATKQIKFDASGSTTGTSVTIESTQTGDITIELPAASDRLIGRDTTDTLTNKTLTDNEAASFQNNGTTVTLPEADTTLVGQDTTDTLSNKSLEDATTLIVDEGAGNGTLAFDVSSATHKTTLTSSAAVSDKTLTLPNATDTLVARTTTDTLTNKTLTAPVISTIVNTGTLTLPTSTDTLVGRATTDTLTNKTLTAPVISTISNTGVLTLPTSTDTLVGRATTDTLTNKTIGDELTLTQIATPSAPASGFNNLYVKSNGLLYNQNSAGVESLVAGAGGSGVNYVGLTTAFEPTNTDDRNAESSVGNWVAYKDAAGVAPVDMLTGGDGSPTVSIARTTTGGEILNGVASFEITKDAANRQGEGVAVVANIPLAYRTTKAQIKIPFKITSGSLVQGDLKVYIYEVDGASPKVVTPYNNDVVGSQGILVAHADLSSDCTQIRVGFHFASTSTTAVTLAFDDVSVGPNSEAIGAAVSNWVSGSAITPTNQGTITNNNLWMRRVGDTLFVEGYYRAGTGAAAIASIVLPAGLAIDYSKRGTGVTTHAGYWTALSAGASVYMYSTVGQSGDVFIDGTTTDRVFLTGQSNSNNYLKINGSSLQPASDLYWQVQFTIPVVGYDSNVTIAQSSTFKISSYLASGSRVTTTPSALGHYRSYQQTVSTGAGTDQVPNTAPSTSSGLAIGGFPFSTAGSGPFNIGRYEIFIGKNKNYKVVGYSSANRTGLLSTDFFSTNAEQSGLQTSYDPTTGVLAVDVFPNALTIGSTTPIRVGTVIGTNGAAGAGVNEGYFDVIVSENALAVGVENTSRLWSGYINNQSFTVTSATLADFGVNASATLTETNNVNFGTVSIYNSGGNRPGFTFTPTATGVYEVTAITSVVRGSDNEVAELELSSTTPTTIAETHIRWPASVAAQYPASLTGFLNIPTLSPVTVRLRAKASAGPVKLNENLNATTGGVWFSIKRIG